MVHKPPIVDDHFSQEVELINPISPSSRVGTTAEQLGIEIDHEIPQEPFERTAVTSSAGQQQQSMPPAPFQQLAPASPGVGEEEGMEALWVEELVSPSIVAGGDEEQETTATLQDSKASTLSRRASSFFPKRMGWKRQQSSHHPNTVKEVAEENSVAAETTASRKKVQTSIKVLDDKEEEPQLHLPRAKESSFPKKNSIVEAAVPMEQRQSSFGEAEANEVREREASEPFQQEKRETLTQGAAPAAKPASLPSEKSMFIAQKAAKARELLATALHPDTDISKCEGLAQAAFAEATAARVMMEGGAPPKGLDLVLRAASHKGRSAALAAAFSPDNTEQQSRAKHYMDLILPIKAFPVVAPSAPRTISPVLPAGQEDEAVTRGDGDISTLGFNHTFSQDSPRHTMATGGSARNMSPMSMSSLNEILDGPAEEEQDAIKKEASSSASPPKYRLPFLKKRTTSPTTKKDDPPEEFTPRELALEAEMPPPEDAPGLDDDDNGSWTDVSLDENGIEAVATSTASNANSGKPRKKKRVFRLARLAGMGGAAAASSSTRESTGNRSEKRSWLRRKKTKGVVPDGPLVDQVPTPPPNVPYQSQPYQRYVANVQVDAGSRASRKSGNDTKDLSTVVLRARDVDIITNERLTSALLADETEHVTSFDGVKMFGQNEDSDDEQEAKDVALDPPEDDEGYLPKRSVKVDPQFVPSPQGPPAILTAQSWDSLLANDAARQEDLPRAVVERMTSYAASFDNKEIPPPGAHYTREHGDDSPVALASPNSVGSGIPGLMDKYSSAEEPAIDDKYSMEEENEDGRFASARSGAEAEDDEAIMQAGSYLDDVEEGDEDDENEEAAIPDTPRRRGLRLGLLNRIQSRRRGQEKEPEEESDCEEEEEDCDDVLQLPSAQTETSRKSRRKLKLFQNFRSSRQQGKDVPVEEVEYDQDAKQVYTDLTLQQTGTMSDTDGVEEIEIENEPEEVLAPSPRALNTAPSDDTTDSLIGRLRKQTSRMRRGKDPVTASTADVARGIDP